MSEIKDAKTLKAAVDAIVTADRLLLTCHVRPDVDALGSVLGLGLAMMDMGKSVTLFTEKSVPDTLGFLPGAQYVSSEAVDPLPKQTTLVILDCNEPERIGEKAQKFIRQASCICVLDHHLSQVPFCAHHSVPEQCHCISFIDPEIFATGAIVLWILKRLGCPISKAIATNLYAAIVSDTGGFRHSNTNEMAFQMAGDLVAMGADPYATANSLYQNYSLGRQRLLGLVLETLEITGHKKVGILHATPEMFRISNTDEHDTDDFVGFVRCIDTVEVAIFIKEAHAGQVFVSLRSKSFFDVAELAREFGGGGHFHAAGFHTQGKVLDVKDALLKRLEPCFQKDSGLSEMGKG